MVKVIDIHIHLGAASCFTPWVQDFFGRHNPVYREQFRQEVNLDRFLAYLDEQGVDRAVLLAEYAPLTTGCVPNEFVAELCRRTDRLVPFLALDMDLEEDLLVQARYALDDLGACGFKMLPSYVRYWPADEKLFPFYALAQQRGVPLLFHTGSSVFPGSRIKYADPLLLDDVADAFPDLTLLLAHGGRPFWYDHARWMVSRHPNVHIDITGMPTRRLVEIFPSLENRADRFFFGSDWPGTGDIRPHVEDVLALPLSDGAKEKILYGNAARLLGL